MAPFVAPETALDSVPPLTMLPVKIETPLTDIALPFVLLIVPEFVTSPLNVETALPDRAAPTAAIEPTLEMPPEKLETALMVMPKAVVLAIEPLLTTPPANVETPLTWMPDCCAVIVPRLTMP